MASGTDGNITWNLNESTWVLTVSGTGDMTNYSTASNVPWASYKSKIMSVVIESGVTTIGVNAFYNCTALTSVKIADTVDTLANYSFRYATALTSITIPKNVSTIGMQAFQGCSSLKEIYFMCETKPYMNKNSFQLAYAAPAVTATVYTKGGWGSDSAFTSTVKGSYVTFTYKELVTVNVNVNVGGSWKPSLPYVNVNGTWKEVVGVYVNVNGTWKEAS